MAATRAQDRTLTTIIGPERVGSSRSGSLLLLASKLESADARPGRFEVIGRRDDLEVAVLHGTLENATLVVSDNADRSLRCSAERRRQDGPMEPASAVSWRCLLAGELRSPGRRPPTFITLQHDMNKHWWVGLFRWCLLEQQAQPTSEFERVDERISRARVIAESEEVGRHSGSVLR